MIYKLAKKVTGAFRMFLLDVTHRKAVPAAYWEVKSKIAGVLLVSLERCVTPLKTAARETSVLLTSPRIMCVRLQSWRELYLCCQAGVFAIARASFRLVNKNRKFFGYVFVRPHSYPCDHLLSSQISFCCSVTCGFFFGSRELRWYWVCALVHFSYQTHLHLNWMLLYYELNVKKSLPVLCAVQGIS